MELQKSPLRKSETDPKEIVTSLLKLLEDADKKTQKNLFELVEIACRREGYGYVFSYCGLDLEWIITYKS